MVLFVRKAANISTSALDKLHQVGWNVRIEDDIVLPTVDVEKIRHWHRWNLNKIRFWSWTEYDQILFIDSDALVKGDLSEVWNVPGRKSRLRAQIDTSHRSRSRFMGLYNQGRSLQLRSIAASTVEE